MFRPDGFDRTFGEMSAEEKHGIRWTGGARHALSHRARAFLDLAAACLRDPATLG
jgi:XTP/dITP diphosphohydrolase